jgi:hypothetical protein
MRSPLLLSIAALAGCSSDPSVGFTLLATLQADTDGVVMQDDAATADAAMADQICVIDVRDASVLIDADPGEGQEVLHDALGDRALAGVDGKLWSVDRSGEMVEGLAVEALAARLTHDGTVALVAHEGVCLVAFERADSSTAWAVPGTDCTGDVGFDVDRNTGTAWIADGQAVATVDPSGEFSRWDGIGADTIDLDVRTGHALVGARGEAWVQSVSDAGSVAWTTGLDGALYDLGVAGDGGVAGVMVDDATGGAFTLLETAEGARVAVHPLPEVASVAFSDNGASLGLGTDRDVYFYDVDVDVLMSDMPSSDNAADVNAWEGVGFAAGGAASVFGTAAAVALIVD